MRMNLFSTRPWRTETLKRWDIIHHGMSQQRPSLSNSSVQTSSSNVTSKFSSICHPIHLSSMVLLKSITCCLEKLRLKWISQSESPSLGSRTLMQPNWSNYGNTNESVLSLSMSHWGFRGRQSGSIAHGFLTRWSWKSPTTNYSRQSTCTVLSKKGSRQSRHLPEVAMKKFRTFWSNLMKSAWAFWTLSQPTKKNHTLTITSALRCGLQALPRCLQLQLVWLLCAERFSQERKNWEKWIFPFTEMSSTTTASTLSDSKTRLMT